VLLAEYEGKFKSKPVKTFTHIFRVKAPLLKKNEVVCLTGSGSALGNWNKAGALMMAKDGNWWVGKVDLPKESFPLKYKYGTYNAKEKVHLQLETGEDRQLHGHASQAEDIHIIHDGFARFDITRWKGAGIAIPVFSLRSKNSFGVGEFTDLKLLADWGKEVGLKVIQILPVNDTSATNTFADSYPYAAISAMALHPMYINLEQVAGRKGSGVIKQIKKQQVQLNSLDELDYVQVMHVKLTALKELLTIQQEDLNGADFLEFFEGNKHWLVPYAAFCYLRDINNTSDFSQWKMHSEFDKEAIEKLVSPKAKHYAEIQFHYFVQFHLHLQLKEAAEYAHKKGLIVKGDIPIGVYRHSIDAWMSPGLFHMEMQAGAPPDDFAVKGQNWGFPIYNWQKMQENGFAWWRQRFEQMSNCFDAFRIDHILGFFRIWSIPLHAVEGIMGHFIPAIPLSLEEFRERGISFHLQRYTAPYITRVVLAEIFGDDADTVKELYLQEAGEDAFSIKESFDTQRKVEAAFAATEQNESNDRIRTGLYDLLSNVILFEVPGSGGTRFHFRITMSNTLSFKHLDEQTKYGLSQLYVDYFYHRQDAFWKLQAMQKLPALKASTNMLICGEDLGMVPPSVPAVMEQLGILSLEIQRMPKDPNKEFFHPQDAPYLSVVTPSTHDMSTIRGWWKEDEVQTRRFFNNQLGQWGEAPAECEAWINKAIILQHLHSPAMWSIFQLQDILGMSTTLRRENADAERINIPADPKHYWRYRMHLTLEDLLKAREFNTELESYIHLNGR
jgi:4-alpha-glucanotransferase